MAAAAIGLGRLAAERFVDAAARGDKPSVIWLQFQECTRTESLRTSHPAIDSLILDLISLDYHETLCAAAGQQAEAALRQAMQTHAGTYVCVVEGAIPTRENGTCCTIGGRTALDIVTEVAGQAGAVIVIGSCASWGGVGSAEPNPTGASGAHTVLKGKMIVNIPGCPANPYAFLGTVLQYAAYGTLPALDAEGRPMFVYQPIDIERWMPQSSFPAIAQSHGSISPIATGVAGAVAGALAGAGYVASRMLDPLPAADEERHNRDWVM